MNKLNRHQVAKQLRQQLGISQRELADQLELSVRTVQMHEVGRRPDGRPASVPKTYILALKALLAGIDNGDTLDPTLG